MALEDRLVVRLNAVRKSYETKTIIHSLADASVAIPYRRIALKSSSKLDRDSLMLLAMLYQEEQDTGMALSAFSSDSGDLSSIWPLHLELLREHHYTAIKEILTFRTDKACRWAKLTSGPNDGPMTVRVKGSSKLDMFFDHCKMPNASDLHILSKAIGEGTAKLEAWMKWKGDRLKHQEWVAGDDLLGIAADVLANDARMLRTKIETKAAASRMDTHLESERSDDKSVEHDYETDDSYESDPLGHQESDDNYESDPLDN